MVTVPTFQVMIGFQFSPLRPRMCFGACFGRDAGIIHEVAWLWSFNETKISFRVTETLNWVDSLFSGLFGRVATEFVLGDVLPFSTFASTSRWGRFALRIWCWIPILFLDGSWPLCIFCLRCAPTEDFLKYPWDLVQWRWRKGLGNYLRTMESFIYIYSSFTVYICRHVFIETAPHLFGGWVFTLLGELGVVQVPKKW